MGLVSVPSRAGRLDSLFLTSILSLSLSLKIAILVRFHVLYSPEVLCSHTVVSQCILANWDEIPLSLKAC